MNPFKLSFLIPISIPFFSSSIHQVMRDQMERFAALTFSVGCASHSSVATIRKRRMGCASHSSVAIIQKRRKNSPRESNPLPTFGEGECSSEKMRSSLKLLPLPSANFFSGLHRLTKSFKSLSQLFALHREEDEEVDMVIGFPTDVQHVTHIRLDGSNNASPMKRMDGASDLLSLHSFSLGQFELAMAGRLDAPLASGNLRLA